MDNTMAPPSKRRKLLAPSQDFSQQSEVATKSSVAPFSHGVEHIPASKPTQPLYARPSPQHVEEVHLAIHKRSVSNAEERRRIVRRQGTAAVSDIISTNSDADLVVAVTASVDALGSTTALTTAAVTVDLPDLSSPTSASSTTVVVSEDSSEPASSSASESSPEPTSSTAPQSSPEPTSSTTPDSSAEPASSVDSSPSETARSSDDSRSSGSPSSTNAPSSVTSSSSDSPSAYIVSPASANSDDDQNESQAETASEYGTGSSVAPSSTSGTAPVTTSSTSGTAPITTSASSSQAASLGSSASSNSTVAASTSDSSSSQTSQIVISPSGSGYSARTSSSSFINSLNLTTSGRISTTLIYISNNLTDLFPASTSTSGSVILVSDFTANYASSTSSTDSQATDSSSSTDLNVLFLATQSNGDVQTITRSDESFTTSLADGQTTVIPPSSTRESDSRASASASSGSVVTISDDQSTVRSTVFSTPSPSSTQSSSDDPSGVGLAGVAGDGATATSNGVSSTSAPASTDNDDDEVAPAGTIAGGVVGGAAGLALIALMILLFLRRYKKRAQLGHLALPPNAAGPLAGSSAGSASGGPGMAERSGLMPFAGAVPALFKHQSRSQHSGSETGERGFQRVAGRKLPSAISEGMTGPSHPSISPSPMSPPPTMPLVDAEGHERNLSSHSFYRDSAGFYGGDGSSPSPDPFSDTNLPATVAGSTTAEQMVMSPGPQRRPTIHKAQTNVLQNPSAATTGTPSWTPSHTAAFARSDTPTSLDGSRNSRFTEEV